jgi:hypothetical protein
VKDLEKIPEYIRGEDTGASCVVDEGSTLPSRSNLLRSFSRMRPRAKEISVRLAIPGGNDSVASTPQTTM